MLNSSVLYMPPAGACMRVGGVVRQQQEFFGEGNPHPISTFKSQGFKAERRGRTVCKTAIILKKG